MKILIAAFLVISAFPLNAQPGHKYDMFQNITGALKTSSGVEKHSGTVKMTLGAEGYTYAFIDGVSQKTWVAFPEAKIDAGDKIETEAGVKMANFNSKSLGLTFESIYFVPGVKILGKSKTAKQIKPEGMSSQVKESHRGVVKETFDSGGYTYIRIEDGGEKEWLATTKTNVKSGDKITATLGQIMHNFTSKTLNRTFDEIYFVSSVTVIKPGKTIKKQGDKPSKNKK